MNNKEDILIGLHLPKNYPKTKPTLIRYLRYTAYVRKRLTD